MKTLRTLQWVEFFFALFVWAVVFLMLIRIVPTFESFFNGFAGTFLWPLPTAGYFMQSWWPVVSLIGLSLLSGLHYWRLCQEEGTHGKMFFVFYRIIPISTIVIGVF
ncbi:MAG TPA: hypothetical protein PLI09_29110, partial [Candidatus Hydrogenedentes bacterium]|nr:hypothetical protein [Candidatus Hydrogenedentota bacterium]